MIERKDFLFPLYTIEEGECWICPIIKGYSRMHGGRPCVYHDGELWNGARLSMHLNVDKTVMQRPPNRKEGYCLHRCDNDMCINPNHLYIGTQKDNARDRSERNTEWRKNNSIAQTGKVHSPETRKRMSESQTIRFSTQEERDKQSKRLKGGKRSKEFCENTSNRMFGNKIMLGIKRTKETKDKMSESAKASWEKRNGK